MNISLTLIPRMLLPIKLLSTAGKRADNERSKHPTKIMWNSNCQVPSTYPIRQYPSLIIGDVSPALDMVKRFRPGEFYPRSNLRLMFFPWTKTQATIQSDRHWCDKRRSFISMAYCLTACRDLWQMKSLIIGSLRAVVSGPFTVSWDARTVKNLCTMKIRPLPIFNFININWRLAND